MTAHPTGNVTFLFTDIEGSSRQWELNSGAMREALARHNALVREAAESRGGYVFKTMGDSFCVAFSEAVHALAAAVCIQHALQAEEWRGVDPLHVRVALHAGTAHEDGGDYLGPTVNRVARLLSIGHANQTLVSEAVRELVAGQDLPDLDGEWELRDLGYHRLRDLLRPERVYQLRYPGLPDEFAPLRSLDSLPNNLPRELSTLVGRETELQQVKEMLASSSLVTLTGAGGCGKTRLAVLVGAEVLGERPEGTWFVELAGVTDGSLLPQAVTSQLGVRDIAGAGPEQALVQHLRDKNLLLILDNCEHLVDASARLVEQLLRSCPRLSVITTSREALGVRGETLFPVPPLAVPGETDSTDPAVLLRNESVRLFCERAASVSPTFQLTPGNAAAVARICRRLDGIPLALELAAARARLLTPAQIAARLDDRFRLLTGGYRTDLPRHQTLLEAIRWSYDLLTERERVLLRRLSVFGGGWTLEAAEAVCPCTGVWGGSPETALPEGQPERVPPDEILDLLARLVDRSLVVSEPGLEVEELPPPLSGGLRYRLLESIREYARERLVESGEEPTLRHRHREFFMGLAEQAEAGFRGPEQGRWLDLIQREMDNIRAALGWSVESEARLRLAAALWRYWYQRGPVSEGRAWLEGSLARSKGCSPEARARALTGAGNLAGLQADYGTARKHLEQCLQIRRTTQDRVGEGSALINLGIIARHQADRETAHGLLEEGLELYRRYGERGDIAAALVNLWTLAHQEGLGVERRGWLEEARELLEPDGDPWRLAMTLYNLGIIYRRIADPDQADAHFLEALRRFRALAEHASIALCVNGLACVALDRKDAVLATRLLAIEQRLRDTCEVPTPESDAARREAELGCARDTLGAEHFGRIWAEAYELTSEEAVAWVLGEEAAPP